MSDRFIFDSNCAYNGDVIHFLGFRDEIKRFSEVGEILIPEIVYEEMLTHKKEQFEKKKVEFENSPFLKEFNLSKTTISKTMINKRIKKIIDNEEIKYQIIKLNNKNAFGNIKRLAVTKSPPFEGKEGKSDKGFKDACIYLTIIDIIEKDSNYNYFCITNDTLLKKALEKHKKCIVCGSFNEYKEYRQSYFYETYFQDVLKDYIFENFGDNLPKNDNKITIEQVDLDNINQLWKLKVKINETYLQLNVDYSSKEILDHIIL